MASAIRLPRRWQIVEPLAYASSAIAENLARRLLQRRGMEVEEWRLAGLPVTTYAIPGPSDVPPTVLIHGLGASAMTWSQLMALLRGSVPIYAVDLPGFGLSSLPPQSEPLSLRRHVAVVTAFLEQVVGRPALLVGNSMGGWLTLRLGLERPDLAAALAVLNPAGVLLEPAYWEATRDLFRPMSCADVRRFYHSLFGRVPLAVYLAQPETLRRMWRRSVQNVLETAAESDFLSSDDLRSIERPVTVIWGMADRLLPAQSLDVLREGLPAARWVLLPGCGHMPQIEQPRRVAAVIREALAGIGGLQDTSFQRRPAVV